jgi:hypothetical protein
MLAVLFWPLLLLAGGIALHMAYWKRMLPSLSLLPGGALIVLSVLFLLCAWFGWSWMGFLWPLIPGALAVGLYEYASAEGSQPLRLSALVTGGISLLCLLVALAMKVNIVLVALLLIVAGVILAARRPGRTKTIKNLRLK